MISDRTTHNPGAAARYAVLGLAFLVMYGALVVVPWTFLALRMSTVAGWMVLVALALTGAVVTWLVPPTNRTRNVAAALTIVVGTFLIAGIVAHNFYDVSFDGRTYHSDGIIALSEGWNPFENSHPGSFGYGNTVRSFPKASWLAASSLYELTGSIEVGKSINILPLGGSFLLVLSLLTRLGVRPGVAWAGSVLAAANPIWVVQSLSNYIDGQSASLLLAAIAAGLWILLFERTRVVSWSLGLSLLLLINLKFSGIFYAGLILMAMTAVMIWQRRWGDFKRFVATQGVVIVLAVGVIGFNPYVQNMLDFDNPFYPIYGENSIDFSTPNTPENLRGASQLKQLAFGLFGRPQNPINGPAFLTWPFNWADLSRDRPYTGADARIAGLGPWFSGGLLVSVALGAWLLYKERKHWRGKVLLVGSLSGFLILSWVLHPEGWWARYTPQLWLVPVAVAVAVWVRNDRISRWLGGLLALVLAMNVFFVAEVYYRSQVENTKELVEIYEGFADSVQVIPSFIQRFHAATRVQLDEAGVTFTEYSSSGELPCETTERLPGGSGDYCSAAAG